MNNNKKIVASAFLVFGLLCRVDLSVCDIFEECDGVPDETFVASNDDCRFYIYCIGEDSMAGSCGEGEYFDSENLSCDDEENVFCPLDVEPEEPDVPVETTTTTLTTTTAATASPTTTTFEPITVPPVVKDKCPDSDDPNQIILMPNSQSCSEYYLCYHGHAIEMQCTNNLHFNTYTGKCDFPENALCMSDRPNANKCLPHVTDFFPHPEKCNYFYYCIRGFMTVQQCPFYYGWDIERRSCVHISQAKCFNSEKKVVP